MKCSTLIYINPDDPRTFVYKHNRYRWLGVTLNFARAKSIPVSAALLLPLLVLPLIARWPTGTGRILSFVIFLLVYVAGLCLYCFRGAARDLRRYPGKPSARC